MLFIDASREFEPGTSQDYLRIQDLEKIQVTFHARQTVDKYAYLADFEELKENEFNLNIPRYVDIFEPEPPVDMVAVNDEIGVIKVQMAAAEEKMVGYLRELGLDE